MNRIEAGTYLITGISGYIGKSLATYIMESDEYKNGYIRILGVSRNEDIAKAVLGDKIFSKITFIQADIIKDEIFALVADIKLDYIIHCAATTTSSYMISNPVEVADGIVIGTKNILEVAKEKKVKSMVHLSSMEAYGTVPDIGRTRNECELGDINLRSSRSCYPMGKRMAEHYCHIYKNEYGVNVKIARLAQVFGTGVMSSDNRVFMQFARAVKYGRDIVLKTTGESFGNYCAVEDAVNAIFVILEKGEAGETYNVVNENNTMTIREMAELVADVIAKGKIKVKVKAEDYSKTGCAEDTKLRMSSEKLRQLGWVPTKNVREMYEDIMYEFQQGIIS